jgi:hypothetical protein
MPYLIFLLLSISLWASEVPEWFSAMSYQSTAAKFVGYGEDTYHHEVIDFLEQKRFSILKITTKSK